MFSFPGNAGVRQEHLEEKVQGEKLEHSVHAVPSWFKRRLFFLTAPIAAQAASQAASQAHRDVPPARVVAESVGHVVAETLGQVVHELCSLQTPAETSC